MNRVQYETFTVEFSRLLHLKSATLLMTCWKRCVGLIWGV